MDQTKLFDEFWKLYPRKIKKKAARKSFERLKPDNELFDKIMFGLERYNLLWEGKQTELEFIPHASTWLNNERWEDDITNEIGQINGSWKDSFINGA